MILRSKGVITHEHDTKLPGEDGEGATADWGTRPSPKAKLLEEDPKDAPTHGRGNKPNPEKDPTLAYGWGNRPDPKKESHVCRRGRQNGLGKVYTYPATEEGQTRGSEDTTGG